MFLDYDGTLSPIVDDPDNALMSDDVRIAHNLLDVQHVLSFFIFYHLVFASLNWELFSDAFCSKKLRKIFPNGDY